MPSTTRKPAAAKRHKKPSADGVSSSGSFAFECERSVLHETLSAPASAAAGANNPIFAGIRLSLTDGHLVATGSDGATTITAETDVQNATDGVLALPAKLTAALVKSMPDGTTVKASMSEDGTKVRLTAGSVAFSVVCITNQPSMPSVQFGPIALDDINDAGAADVSISDGADFAAALKQTLRAASSDAARPILTGVVFKHGSDGLQIAATDSYRLAVRDTKSMTIADTDTDIIIPANALSSVCKHIQSDKPLDCRLSSQVAGFQSGGVTIITRLIEGDFPNYKGLIPDPSKAVAAVEVDRMSLLWSVQRVTQIAGTDMVPVHLVVDESADEIAVRVNNPEIGDAVETVHPAMMKGSLTIAYNPGYLVDGLNACTGTKVKIDMMSETAPSLIESLPEEDEDDREKDDDGSRFRYVLMPIRRS